MLWIKYLSLNVKSSALKKKKKRDKIYTFDYTSNNSETFQKAILFPAVNTIFLGISIVHLPKEIIRLEQKLLM